MRLGITTIVLFSTLLLAGPTRADLIPPEVGACQNKLVGTACTYNGTGVCQAQTCSRLDYSNWDRDASSSPPSTTYACNKCVTGTATDTQTGTSTPTDTGTGTQTGTSIPTDTGTGTQTGTSTKPDDPPSNDDGACSVGKQITAKRIAPWLLASAFSLFFLFGRRRRR